MQRKQERHLVTGGGGYVGSFMAKALLDLGLEVVLLDVTKPKTIFPDNVKFIQADISDYDDILSAFDGVDCVYHMASYGMSGREQLNKTRIETVNVKGTENVIKACQHAGVTRLVYTSTYNVVFGGQEIRNGDESLPYLPLEKHPDHYSRTKSIAEMTVLEANGLPVGGNNTVLQSCALRLAGVYGPGEERHLPRIVSYVQKGLFAFTYGAENSLVEFLHIDNLVQAHLLAAEALKETNSRAAGQAYFISDCKPINNFEFFRPLIEGLGYRYPKIRLPLLMVYFFAFLTEFVHHIVGKVYNFQPLLTRTEVYKTGVTHYFNISKARTHLGYTPTVQNDINTVLQWYKERGYKKNAQRSVLSKTLSIMSSILLSFIFTAFLLSWLPTAK